MRYCVVNLVFHFFCSFPGRARSVFFILCAAQVLNGARRLRRAQAGRAERRAARDDVVTTERRRSGVGHKAGEPEHVRRRPQHHRAPAGALASSLHPRLARSPRPALSGPLSLSLSLSAAPQPLLRTHRTCAAPQDKAEEAHLSAAATGLLPVLEGAIAADRIPPEHLPAARRALERFHAVQGRAQRVEADALAAERARLTLASDNAAEALLAEEELEAQARHLALGIGVRVRVGSGT